MFINELSAPALLVVYPGRFQPFHKGHHQVFEWLSGKFGRNNVFIASSNKTDNAKSPFTFAEKAYFMQLTGVPADRIVQATSPYQIESVLASGQVQVQNPDNTVVIFAVSEKDMAEDPRFASWTKKDGSPAYFQPLTDIKQTKSMKEHGYIMTVPTFQFNVAGDPMQSSTELRAEYKVADEKKRQLIITDLFGRYTREAEHIMTGKLAPAPAVAPAEAPRPTKLPKTQPAAGLKEDIANTNQGQAAAQALKAGILKHKEMYPNLDPMFGVVDRIEQIQPNGTIVMQNSAEPKATAEVKKLLALGGGANFKVIMAGPAPSVNDLSRVQ
jgi:cytidyltransferase-like protein